MSTIQEMSMVIDTNTKNESFSRMVVAAYASRLDPTVEQIADLKTAVSEAVTNAIIHGYENKEGNIYITCRIQDQTVTVEIRDEGVGIANIEQAMEPLYTTRPEWERSGMGFAFMEAFMDELTVESEPGKGTRVVMSKTI